MPNDQGSCISRERGEGSGGQGSGSTGQGGGSGGNDGGNGGGNDTPSIISINKNPVTKTN